MREYHKTMDKRMFDFADFYTSIAQRLPHNSVIAEVGVADGASAIYLAETILNMGKRFKLYLIDNMAYGGADQLNVILNHVVSAGLLPGSVEILSFDSLNASCRFPDNHFDFVFLDSSHRFEQTKAEIRLWYRKLKDHNAFLAGHDYNDGEGREVKQAVDLLLPRYITRPSQDGVEYKREQFLRIEATEKGYGVWWTQSRFYYSI